MAEYYSIETRDTLTITIDKNLYEDLNNYAKVTHSTKSEAINKVLFSFFKSKILTNTYLTNRGGLQFKIPLDLDVKKQCIKDKTILNSDNANFGVNSALITINQIPNNLDVFTLSDDNTAGSYKANINGVLHHGIDFIFIPEAIEKPVDINFDIDLIESLYLFYFEVKANNTVDVVLINPTDAINKLSNANNGKLFKKYAEMVQLLEVEEKQIKNDYWATITQLRKRNKKSINDKRIKDIINEYFTILEMDLLKNETILNMTFKNDNVKNNCVNNVS